MSNKKRFTTILQGQYEHLFTLQKYAYVAGRNTPADLAKKMVDGLIDGSAMKDGEGIKITCKVLGVKYTYTAIKDFLNK
jgi:hypothetical protein